MRTIPLFNRKSNVELNLRQELNQFLFGSNMEIPKGQLYVLRSMRLQPGIVYPVKEADLFSCDCKTKFENEPEIDYRCNICDGEGYLFDDRFVTGYKTSRFEYQDIEKYKAWGKQTTSLSFFYIESDELISRFDKILEPVIDKEGRIASPVRILKKANIHMAESLRSDNGRIEYWRCSTFSE